MAQRSAKFGTPICDQIMIDVIKRIVDKLNICKDDLEQFEIFTPHCLRHTFATRCFEAEVPPKTVQQFLGHATLQMTMDLYTHVLDSQKADGMMKLENLLDNVFTARMDDCRQDAQWYGYVGFLWWTIMFIL